MKRSRKFRKTADEPGDVTKIADGFWMGFTAALVRFAGIAGIVLQGMETAQGVIPLGEDGEPIYDIPEDPEEQSKLSELLVSSNVLSITALMDHVTMSCAQPPTAEEMQMIRETQQHLRQDPTFRHVLDALEKWGATGGMPTDGRGDSPIIQH